MKKRLITAIICLSLVFVMFLGVVSATPEITSLTADKSIGLVPLTITLTATTTGTIDIYSWDIGNNTIINTTTNTLTVTYDVANTNGVYTVSLTVNDTDGEVSTATLDILARPNCPAGDGTCLFAPQNRCDTQNKGIGCIKEIAERYCKEQGYVDYDPGSMTCEVDEHDTGSRVRIVGGVEDCGAGARKWILSLRCLSMGTCTENDTSTDLAEQFVFGNASEEGVDWLDSCIAGTDDKLNESYCDDNGQLAWREVTCSEGCSGGVCIFPTGGLVCNPDSSKGLSNTIGQTKRARNEDDVIYYCGLDLEWHEAKELRETCTAGYECISNSCVEEECYGVRTELEEQRNILIKIWCFLTNMGEYIKNRGDIQAANNVIDDIKTVAPNYGGCLEAPFGTD